MSPADDRTAAIRRPAEAGSPAQPEVLASLACVSDQGLVRKNNEDSFLVADLAPGGEGRVPAAGAPERVGPKGVLLAVSDGMGGQLAGEVASRIAVDTLLASLRRDWSLQPQRDAEAELRNDLRIAVDLANQAVVKDAAANPERQGMGATLTAAVVFGRAVLVAHVGDSRCYLLRAGFLKRLTSDQSLAEELVREGVLEPGSEAYNARRSVLTKAVGQAGRLVPDSERADLAQGDRLLLCSDGLTGPVPEESIAAILGGTPDPAAAVRRLVEEAHRNGAPDNVTCVVAWLSGPGLPEVKALESSDGTMSIAVDAAAILAGSSAGESTQQLSTLRRDRTAEFAAPAAAGHEVPGSDPARLQIPPVNEGSDPAREPARLQTPPVNEGSDPEVAGAAVGRRGVPVAAIVVALIFLAGAVVGFFLSR